MTMETVRLLVKLLHHFVTGFVSKSYATDACLIDARLVVALPRQCSEGRKQGWSQTAIRRCIITRQRVLDDCCCRC